MCREGKTRNKQKAEVEKHTVGGVTEFCGSEVWQGGDVVVNIHTGWTPEQAWPWQGWEQPFGYSGKSQLEA